jgi:hypothetical protein
MPEEETPVIAIRNQILAVTEAQGVLPATAIQAMADAFVLYLVRSVRRAHWDDAWDTITADVKAQFERVRSHGKLKD